MEKNFFNFLSSNDRALLESKAKSHQRTYKEGEVILEQGGQNASLYIIRGGDVSIVSHVMEHNL
ncbi:MAG TPA: hypothetical protein VIU36_05625, partial [Gammaproteobacteria bacterium]